MSYITRKMTIAINHHRHRCDTLYPACHLISSTYTAWPGFSFFTFFRRDNFSCFASFFPCRSFYAVNRSFARSLTRTLQFQLTVSALLRFSPLRLSSPPAHSPVTLSFTRSMAQCALAQRPKIQSLKAKNKEKIISVNGIFSVSAAVAVDALIVLAWHVYKITLQN